MAAEQFELGDFGPVGGVPEYALRGPEKDPLADNVRYGDSPDGLAGVSGEDNGTTLSDPDAAEGPGMGEAADPDTDGPGWLGFGDLIEETPVAHASTGRAPGSPSEAGGEADQHDDVVAADEVAAVGAPEEVNLPADGPEDEHSAAGEVAAAESAEAPDAAANEGQLGTDGAEQAADSLEDDPARIIAETLGIDLDEARGLVDEALSDEHAEDGDHPDDDEPHEDGAGSDEAAPGDQEDGQESSEAALSKERVVSFLRSVASSAGNISTREANAFAEGFRAAGGDLRQWYGDRHERGNRRAMKKARRGLSGNHKKWDKLGKRMSGSGVEAPRRNENR